MKKIKSFRFLALAALLGMGSMNAFATDVYRMVGGIAYRYDDAESGKDGTASKPFSATVCGVKKADVSLTIPVSANFTNAEENTINLQVVGFDSNWNKAGSAGPLLTVDVYDKVTSMTIDITKMSSLNDAFANLTKLASLTIKDDSTTPTISTLDLSAVKGTLTTLDIFAMKGYTDIVDNAFKVSTGEFDKLTSITLPATLKTIGANAFAYSKLTAVTIPGKVESIGSGAFNFCEAASITFEANEALTSFGTNHSQFGNCKSLTTIDMSNLKNLAGNLPASIFSGCSKLAEVDLSGTQLTGFGSDCFNGNSALATVKLPATVASLTARMFNGTKVASLDLSNTAVTVIPKQMFAGNTVLTGITLPENLVTIDSKAFQSATALANITIPAKVTGINWAAFSGCVALAEVKLADAPELSYIGEEAFAGTKLASFAVPAKVKTINNKAFNGCAALASVDFSKAAELTTIGDYAFKGTALTAVDLDGAVKLATLGTDAFSGLALTSLRLEKTLLAALPTLTDAKESLTAITLPAHAGFTSIEDDAFKGFTALTSIVIPENVATVGKTAFQNCDAMTSVTIEGAAAIGTLAFNNCDVLATVTFEKKDFTVAAGAFANCPELASIDLSKANMTAVPGYLFRNDAKLASITWPENVKSLGTACLEGTVIPSLNLPTVNDITHPFGERTATSDANTTLQTLVLGKASIASCNFANFTALTDVTVAPKGTSANEIKERAFYGCTALKNFTYEPEAAITAGSVNEKAFNGCVAFINFITNNYYTEKNAVAPMNCKYAAGQSVTINTVADQGTSGKYFAKLNVPAGKQVRIVKTDDLKIYTVYAEEFGGDVYLQALRARNIDGVATYVIKGKENLTPANVIIKTDVEKEITYTAMTYDGVSPTSLYDDEIICLTEDVAKADYEFNNLKAGEYIYMLTNKKENGGFGFTYFVGTTMKAGNFYLKSTKAPATSAPLKMIWLDEDGNVEEEFEATGIDSVETVGEQSGAVYNMAGQKVGGSYKGLVIKNGKKVMMK